MIVALATPTTFADPDARPDANARTTLFGNTDSRYSFSYAVDYPEYRNFFDHEEDRAGDVTRGRFRVALPDNRLQTVTYRAGNKGYIAHISYDQHPNFEALREAVGPIREAPEVGQAVVPGVHRGENWKNRKNHPKHQAINNVVPTTHERRPMTTPRPAFQSHRRPTPESFRPSPTSSPFKPRPTPTTKRPQRFRPTPDRSPMTTPTSHFGPMAQRLTSNALSRPHHTTTSSRPTATRRPPAFRPRPATSFPTQASIFVSTEGLEDPEILNKLIEAIRLKVEAEESMNAAHGHHHGDDDDSHEKKDKPRYTISDKPGVLSRLGAIVHAFPLSKL